MWREVRRSQSRTHPPSARIKAKDRWFWMVQPMVSIWIDLWSTLERQQSKLPEQPRKGSNAGNTATA
eukprot:scaffold205880_cov18-Tisochrysis_lutea.AAC.3